MDTYAASAKRTENIIEKKEKNWRCDKCSVNNEASTKRCESCGEPRFAVSSILIGLPQRQEMPPTKEYNQIASSNRYQKSYQNRSLDQRNSGKF